MKWLKFLHRDFNGRLREGVGQRSRIVHMRNEIKVLICFGYVTMGKSDKSLL